MLLATSALLTFSGCTGSEKQGDSTTGDENQTTGSTQKEQVILSEDGSGLTTYQNPLITPTTAHAWSGYGVGDPFVMRWNGRYYLYCSTKDGERGIQCWTSDDLVNWEFAGMCANEKLTVGAYAPEVVYYNGYFYMYTSPAGNGHYVLKSDSPTGPFKAVTGNLGLSIDGDVFIDEDGKWYFYSASNDGIKCYTMTSPSTISTNGMTVGAYMNGWTEGPMVILYDGIYYMTFTGNHVWSNGYRINYAASTRTPTAFSDGTGNPLLVSTDTDSVYGIGHSSTVMGPNLDSYYIVYHSSLGAPKRQLNIDRLVLNGTYLEALGPTTTDQQTPEMPDLYNYFDNADDTAGWVLSGATVSSDGLLLEDGGMALSELSFSGDYTAEINVLSVNGEKAGAVFSYVDDQNYGTALFNRANGSLEITFVVNGQVGNYEKALVKSFDEDVDLTSLQAITIRKSGNEFTFLVNNLELVRLESDLGSGAFGVLSKGGSALIGFVGGTGDVWQSSIKKYYKPISGDLLAITCVEDNADLTLETIKKTKYVQVSTEQCLNYRVNVEQTGNYDVGITYRSSEGMTLEIYQNGTLLQTVSLPASPSADAVEVVRSIPLTGGFSAITFRVTSGSGSLYSYQFELGEEVTAIDLDFSSARDKNSYSDGSWQITNGALVLNGGSESVGKRLYGSENWGDYTVEADIQITGSDINFGLLVRATNPSVGGAGDDVVAGTNFVQGYFIGLGSTGVDLDKENYGWQTLTSYSTTIKKDTSYHLKVSVVGNTITVWLDDVQIIEYQDNDHPFLQGMAGFRGFYSIAEVDKFSVTPVT